MKKNIHIYLVSDSTGETVMSVARSAFAHFEDLIVEEHLWSLVRSRGQIDKLANELQKEPGIVMFTMVNQELKNYIQETCTKMHILSIPVIDEVVHSLSNYLNIKINNQPGRQHAMDDDYFKRMNAINFSLAHDDGQSYFDLEKADIILVGPSRTSKSPTSIYLAYRGYKTANIPYVLDQKLPEELDKLKNPLIVGLLINYERLIEIRKNRLVNLNEVNNHSYINIDLVNQEILEAKKLYQKKNWPIIDVTRKSVEETAANIITMYKQKNKQSYL